MSNPSKARGTAAESRVVCGVCSSPVPAGRRKYCSDYCLGVSTVARVRARDDKRIAACSRCQGPKEPGTRGGKYCAECRQVVADSSAHAEYERGRRKNLAQIEGKLASGGRVRSRTAGAPDGTKWCARCQEFRLLTSFPPRKDSTAKTAAYCIPCQRSYNRERRVMLVYGLTYDEYEMLLACQDYRCAICGGRPRKNALSVDHDHQTGEIRGLLCSRCNHKLLGSANDDPVRLRKAADYLEEYQPREVFGAPRFVPGSAPGRGAGDLDGILTRGGVA